MPSLHHINHPDKLARAYPFIAAEDAVFLFEQGVNLLYDTSIQLGPHFYYALAEDCQARNIRPPEHTCQIINLQQWVELTLEYDHVCSW